MVDGDTGYNVILTRPLIHEMKVVPTTYYQLLKFQTSERIKKIRGDQPAAKEMNAITLSRNKAERNYRYWCPLPLRLKLMGKRVIRILSGA